ncbi:protein LEKR1 isoform X2 [Mus musculus]|uniref:protein LEKR1 isoform X2 n=1 Tax=Mus musculus TaxID=10090 RepID=UPI0005ABAAFD|nr:protein LEKR1 isoform X2 [Mus musculus]|eukprot:XP_011238488.1 PREDICTED: leucine-, glutamate- and lysine-rich protein 1 isoform X2 [Mus musculus]
MNGPNDPLFSSEESQDPQFHCLHFSQHFESFIFYYNGSLQENHSQASLAPTSRPFHILSTNQSPRPKSHMPSVSHSLNPIFRSFSLHDQGNPSHSPLTPKLRDRTVARHKRLLKEKEDSLITCQQLYKTVQEELTTKERQEEDIKRRINLTENELEMTKSLLLQTQEEILTLKNERELMLVSHQKSIEQLQETLRQKLLSDDSWREKIEAELSKERARHLIEFQDQALLFKEEAKLELDIEKEKHQEIIRKYQQEHEDLQRKIGDLIADATKDLRLEVASLQEKLHESHAQYTEESESKKKEIEDLKNLVAEFQCRLKQETGRDDSISEELKKEMKQKSDELERVRLAQTQLLQQFSQSQEENTFLQETVRRECEERFELTEALSQAKEQLLELRRSGGNLPCSLNKGTLTYPASAVSNHRELSSGRQNCGRGTGTPSLRGLPKPTASPTPDKLKKVSSSGLPALSQAYPPRGRAISVNEARQRLTAILRRRLSQQ